MPRSDIIETTKTVEVNRVTILVFVPATQQDDDGNWVAELRVFGENPDEPDAVGPQVFVLRLLASDKQAVQLTTPPLNF